MAPDAAAPLGTRPAKQQEDGQPSLFVTSLDAASTDFLDLIATAYRDAARSCAQMMVATEALETVRSAIGSSGDAWRVLDEVDDQIGFASGAALRDVLVELRRGIRRLAIRETQQRLYRLLLDQVAAGWTQWLACCGEAIAQRRPLVCEALCEMTILPAEADCYRQWVKMVRANREAEAYEIFVRLAATESLLARHRVSLLVLAAQVDMWILLRLGRAQEHLERASALVPDDPDLLAVWSDYWRKRRDTPRANETLEKLRGIAPGALAAQLAFGDQYEQAGKLADADASYRQALAARPGDARPYRQLIRLFAHADWLEEHRAELDGLVKRRVVLTVDDDAGYGTYCEVGRALKEAGDLDTARSWFQQASATDVDGSQQEAYIELAWLEVDVGNNEAAQAALAQAAAVVPESFDVSLTDAYLTGCRGDWRQALTKYERCLQLRPSWEADLRGRMADAHRVLGDFPAAERELLTALRLDPTDEDLLTRAASLAARFAEKGQLDDALRVLSEVRQVVGPAYEAEYHNQCGNAYLARGDYRQALTDLTRAIELDPDNAWTIANRGETYRLMGQYREALVDFTRAVELDPCRAWAIASRGQTYQTMGRYDEALVDFTRAIELDPCRAWMIANRGETYRLMGRYDEALVDLTRAIELDPAYAWAIAGRGATYRAVKRYDEALVDLTRAIELDPAYAWAIASRGLTYQAMGRYDEALADFTRAIELNPVYTGAIASRGQTYQAMGRYDEALVDLTRATELDPDNAWTIANRGETYRLMGRYDEALADFTRAIELNPVYTWAIASRGQTYQAMGRYDEALADLTRATELDPDKAWVIASRGQTYQAMGRYDEARTDLTRAIELAPDKVRIDRRPVARLFSRRRNRE